MKKAKIIDGFLCLAKDGDITELYSMEDIKVYPNVSEVEIEECDEVKGDRVNGEKVVGFVKAFNHNDEKPSFIQVYENEVEILIGDSPITDAKILNASINNKKQGGM